MTQYNDRQRADVDEEIEDYNNEVDEQEEDSLSVQELKAARHKELLDYDEMIANQAEEAEDLQNSEEYEEVAEPEVVYQPQKHKIKVNGRDVELTTEELIARASKVEAADEYLRQAKTAYETSSQNYGNQPSKDVDYQHVEEDDIAIVRAIQMGDEEEAVAAIRKLRQGPSIKQDDIGRIVDERVAFQRAAEFFQEEFADIANDPYLAQMAANEDARLMQSGFSGSYEDRFATAGKAVREWRDSFIASQTKNQPEQSSMIQKQQRKAAVSQVPATQQRASKQIQQELDEEDYDAAYIRKQMANQRRY
jgi:hypothetical protein